MRKCLTKENFNDFLLKSMPIVFFSALTGLVSGIIVVLYGYGADFLSHASFSIYIMVREAPAFIPLLLLALCLLAFISYILLKIFPDAIGSTIPYNHKKGCSSWWQVLTGTITRSYVSFFASLSLGVEGPSTTIGIALGEGISKIFKSRRFSDKDLKEVSRYVSSSGTASAITAVLNAPIAGLTFMLEEVERRVSLLALLGGATSVTTSYFTSYALRSLLEIEQTILPISTTTLPLNYYWTLPIVAVATGLLGVAFASLLSNFKQLKFIKRIPVLARLIFTFIVTGLVGVALTYSLGGGASLIKTLFSENLPTWVLLTLLILEVLLTTIAMGSESSGGLLLPSLAIGALIGALLGKLLVKLGLPSEYYHTFILLGAFSFLGTVFHAPVTSIVLAFEMTGIYNNVIPVALEVVLSFAVAELALYCIKQLINRKKLKNFSITS